MRLAWLFAIAGCGRIGFGAIAPDDDGALGDAMRHDSGQQDASGGSPVVPSGALMWLRFDDPPSDGVADSAGNHDGACVGACPAVIAAHHKEGYDFAGQPIIVNDVTGLDVQTPFTLSVWFRIDAYPPGGMVGAMVTKEVGPESLGLEIDAQGRVRLRDGTSFNGTLDSNPIGVWRHVAVTYDGSGTQRFYVAGALRNTAAGAMIAVNSGSIVIGTRSDNSAPFDGKLDELLFYGRVLTAAEIAAIAAQ